MASLQSPSASPSREAAAGTVSILGAARHAIAAPRKTLRRRRLATGYRCRIEVLTLPVAVGDDLPSDRDPAGASIVQRGAVVDYDLLIGLLERDEVTFDEDDGSGNDFVAIVSGRTVAVRGPSVTLPASTIAVVICRRRAGRRRCALSVCNCATSE
jgi:hypothetical protein